MKIIKEWRWTSIALILALLAAVVFVTGYTLGGVGRTGLFSAMLSIVEIPFLVVFLFLALRLRDRIGGINWQKSKVTIMKEPLSAAIYFSAWVIGVSWIISST